MFHSRRTSALLLDTDSEVESNQQQGAEPVLRHIKLAKPQNGYVSAWFAAAILRHIMLPCRRFPRFDMFEGYSLGHKS
jgi:hypothetical protein